MAEYAQITSIQWPRLYDPVRQVLRHRVSLKCHPAPRPTPHRWQVFLALQPVWRGVGGRGAGEEMGWRDGWRYVSGLHRVTSGISTFRAVLRAFLYHTRWRLPKVRTCRRDSGYFESKILVVSRNFPQHPPLPSTPIKKRLIWLDISD